VFDVRRRILDDRITARRKFSGPKEIASSFALKKKPADLDFISLESDVGKSSRKVKPQKRSKLLKLGNLEVVVLDSNRAALEAEEQKLQEQYSKVQDFLQQTLFGDRIPRISANLFKSQKQKVKGPARVFTDRSLQHRKTSR
jgi:hypothetical protein